MQPVPEQAATITAVQPTTLTQLTVVLPAYEEAEAIATTIQATVATLTTWQLDYEVIVVNDGSSDATATIVAALAQADPHICLVNHATNQGYGAALISGFQAATKTSVFFMDADGQFDIGDLVAFFPLLATYDAILGYRIHRHDPPIRRLNAWGWKQAVRVALGVHVRDLDCAFKLLPAAFVHGVTWESRGALINAEIVTKLQHAGYTFTQVGVHHSPRRAGRATGARLGVIVRAFQELRRYRRHWRQH